MWSQIDCIAPASLAEYVGLRILTNVAVVINVGIKIIKKNKLETRFSLKEFKKNVMKR